MPRNNETKPNPEDLKKDELSQLFLDTRSIVLSAAVDSELAEKVIKQILVLEKKDPQGEIRVYINSPGGSVDAGFAIFDMLKFVSCPVTTIICGLAASMGSVLSLVGDKGRKFALPNARIMIHQPLLQGAEGNITDLEIHSKQILKTRTRLAQMYAEVTGKPVEQVLKDLDRDHWLSADEALEYGLLDKVIVTAKELDT